MRPPKGADLALALAEKALVSWVRASGSNHSFIYRRCVHLPTLYEPTRLVTRQ